jgi:ATP-dependent DNA helicase RecQ
MADYLTTRQCLLQFLRLQLNDPTAQPCGRCANCRGRIFDGEAGSDLVAEALVFLKRSWLELKPRVRRPSGVEAKPDTVLAPGRALSSWGDPGWGDLVREGKYSSGVFSDDLVAALVELLKDWSPEPFPTWVTCVPDREGDLVSGMASRLASRLELEFLPVVKRVRANDKQKLMANSYQQCNNVMGAFVVDDGIAGPCFLIDDLVDSGWTFTVVGAQLLEAGAEVVYPVALADSSRSGS